MFWKTCTILILVHIFLVNGFVAFGEDVSEQPLNDVYVSGSICDESSHPLNGVLCLMSWFSAEGITGRVTHETLHCDGSYRILRPSSRKLSIIFTKPGFITVELDPALNDRDTMGPAIKGVPLFVHNIVMRPETTATALLVVHDRIGGVRFTKNWNYLSIGERDIQFKTVTTETCTVGMGEWVLQLPETSPYITCYIAPSTNAERLLVKGDFDRNPYPVTPRDGIAMLRMVNGGTTDGMILTNPVMDRQRQVDFPSGMMVAPEDGYTSGVVVPLSKFNGELCFVYFRVGGHYGKIMITDLDAWCKDRNSFGGIVDVCYQDDGTTSLPTRQMGN